VIPYQINRHGDLGPCTPAALAYTLMLMVMLFYILQTCFVKNCTNLEGLCASCLDPILRVALPIFLPLMVNYKCEGRVSFSGTTFELQGGTQNIPDCCRHLYSSCGSAKHRPNRPKCEFRVLLRHFAATAWKRAKTSPRTLARTDLASSPWQRSHTFVLTQHFLAKYF
jgi:hypothetical protein